MYFGKIHLSVKHYPEYENMTVSMVIEYVFLVGLFRDFYVGMYTALQLSDW